MSLLNAVMVPHPPLIIPAVGSREDRKIIQATTDAYKKAAAFIHEAAPDTLIVISPHTVMYRDWFHISPGDWAEGDFENFGAPEIRFEVDYDEELSDVITYRASDMRFPAGTMGEKAAWLDHGTMVPLYFLKEAYGDDPFPAILRVGLSGRPLFDHYYLGVLINGLAEELGRNISVVSSGDLSHKLLESGPYGFDPAGPEYDRQIMDVMGAADFGKLFEFSESFCDNAAECGHRAFTMMAGFFDGRQVKAEALSHEGPFGVGYGVCLFTPGDTDPERDFLEGELRRQDEKLQELRAHEDEYVSLARNAVETYVKEQKSMLCPRMTEDRDLVELRSGVFVSLHMDGQLRGCIGTIDPQTDCIGEEIILNAVNACSRDPRFPAVSEEELPYLEYKVDVLTEPEPVLSADLLDPVKYGVVVTSGEKLGLLLPDLDGVDTVEKQIAIAKQKAGINDGEECFLHRFTVIRHS
ncbi:MAG: AmmeMemoRadiSam system protein A [Firmicutes bacterium]|nr:AmmeMemoRadiSam system protein A [Bacillota bacterium]